MSGWHRIGHFSLPLAYNLKIPPTYYRKQAHVAEETCQTLLSNRNPGHVGKVHAAHIIKPISFHNYRKKHVFDLLNWKNIYNIWTRPDSYLCLNLSIHVPKSHIHLVRLSCYSRETVPLMFQSTRKRFKSFSVSFILQLKECEQIIPLEKICVWELQRVINWGWRDWKEWSVRTLINETKRGDLKLENNLYTV